VVKVKAFVLKRPLLTACSIATALGVACGFMSASTMIVVAVAVLFAFTFILPFKTEFKPVVLITALACIAIIISNVIYYNFSYKPATAFDGTTTLVECEVLKTKREAAVVMCNVVDSGEKFKASVTLDGDITPVPSQKLSMTVDFYDCVRRSRADGVHIYGSASDVKVLSQPNPRSVRYMYYRLRQNIKKAMPFKNNDTVAFVNGMVFGDTQDISPKINNMLGDVGLSHVTSVSGMHLMFSVLLIDFIMSLFALRHKKRAVMAIIAVVLFTVISGFSVSCIRAAIMITIYYIGIINDRLSDSLTSLSVAVFVIVLLLPQYAVSLSLLLSAAATFGIIVLSPCFNQFFKFSAKNRSLFTALSVLVGFLTMSLSACVACLPVTAAMFGQFCVISPIVNVLLAIPMQILFYIGIFGLILSKVPLVSQALSFVGDALYNLIEFVVKKCYYIKNTSITVGYKYYYIVVALIVIVVLGLYLFYKTKRAIKLSVLYIGVFALICTVLFCFHKITTKDDLTVHFVDVGDGNCSVVSKDESALIIDCGGDYFKNIEKTLLADNVKRIKLVALTHFNADHVNYLKTLVGTYDVDAIAYPYFANAADYADILLELSRSGTRIMMLESDSELSVFDNVKIKWYVEKSGVVKKYDNMSAVYRLEVLNNSILYTGDMSIHQEHAYLDYSGAMNCDILNVAHHGSKTSSYIKFLKLCSPQYSVVSVNENSKFGNPSKIVIDRLQSVSDVLLTSENSTISFKFNNKGYKLIK